MQDIYKIELTYIEMVELLTLIDQERERIHERANNEDDHLAIACLGEKERKWLALYKSIQKQANEN